MGNLSDFNPDMLSKSLNAFFPKLSQKKPEVTKILQDIYASNIEDDDHLGWYKVLSQV